MKKVVTIIFLFSFLKNTSGACPNGSIEFQNNCYVFQSNATSFTNAELACLGLGGHLASIHDGFTNAVLAGQAGNIFHESTVTDFWMGLSSLMIPGTWSWTDNSNSSFTEWASSEPQNLSMACASVTMKSGFWKSNDCFQTKPSVCAISTEPTYPAYFNCSEGWIYFEPTHSCYGHDGFAAKNTYWTTAEQYCETMGAHLPSIHSDEEVKLLTAFTQAVGNTIWTGLTSNDNEVTWKWSDGSQVDYLPWAKDNPKLNASSCVYMQSSKIYDIACASTYAYTICKKPVIL